MSNDIEFWEYTALSEDVLPSGPHKMGQREIYAVPTRWGHPPQKLIFNRDV